MIGLCVVDASVREICTKGDSLLTEETGKVSFFWKVPNKKIKPKKAKKTSPMIKTLRTWGSLSVCVLHTHSHSATCRVCAKFFHPRVRFFGACVFVCVVCVCMGTQRSNKIMRSEDTLAVSQLSAVEMTNRLKDFFPSPRYTKRRRNWRRVSRFRHVFRSTIVSATFPRLRMMPTTRWRLAMWSKCKWQLDKSFLS